ncbi:MAG: ASCH domain-containing protein [Legionellaceae bacterium]|nr:ASCH domain-containing protein [Legionellaceae bacterium]
MKALTIKQPWASLIAQGIKDIENRTWRTNFRGRIYIHAAGRSVQGNIKAMFTENQYPHVKNTVFGYWQTSAIIGEVEIVDCVQNHPSIWAEHGVWNWVLANPVLYKNPILNVKGKLSFWDYRRDGSKQV